MKQGATPRATVQRSRARDFLSRPRNVDLGGVLGNNHHRLLCHSPPCRVEVRLHNSFKTGLLVLAETIGGNHLSTSACITEQISRHRLVLDIRFDGHPWLCACDRGEGEIRARSTERGVMQQRVHRALYSVLGAPCCKTLSCGRGTVKQPQSIHVRKGDRKKAFHRASTDSPQSIHSANVDIFSWLLPYSLDGATLKRHRT